MQDKLKKYIVPVEFIVYGESAQDAIEYVQDAIDSSNLLEQDGVLGVNPDIEEDAVELVEEGL
jgi:hypothetical protein